jgi:hypothetical protein
MRTRNDEPADPPDPRASGESARRVFWPAARWAAVALFAAAQIFLGRDDTPVADEARHLRDGAIAWQDGRVDVNPEHPPLVKLLAAATLPETDREAARAPAAANPTEADPIETDAEFAVRVRLVGGRLLRVRLPAIGIAVLGLIAFGSLFRRLTPAAPFAATVLLAAAPPWLAHSHYVTTDVAPVAFLLLAAAAADRWRDARGGALSGFWAGAALASKFSAPLLVPFLFVWIFRRGRGKALLAAVAAAAIVLLGIEAFASRGMSAEDLRGLSHRAFEDGALGGTAPPAPRFDRACSTLALWSRPAAAYAIGFLAVAHRSATEAGADYWAGEIVAGPQPLYPLETLLFKNDLPFLALAVLGAILLFRLPKYRDGLGAAIAVSAIVLYVALAARSSLHLGVRHLLPVVALFAGLGAFAVVRPGLRVVFWFLVGAHVVIAAATFPHEIGYRNIASRFVLPSERSWDLGDDWGQDLGRALRSRMGAVTYVSVLQYRSSQWRALFPKLVAGGDPIESSCPCFVDRVAIDVSDAERRKDVPAVARPQLAAIQPILDRVERLRRNAHLQPTSEPSLVLFEAPLARPPAQGEK